MRFNIEAYNVPCGALILSGAVIVCFNFKRAVAKFAHTASCEKYTLVLFRFA